MTNVEAMPARLFLSSGDMIADRRFDFARDLQLKGDLAAAADLLLQATDLAPGFASAWFTLGQIREQLGERDAAIAAFRKALDSDPDDRHGAETVGEGQRDRVEQRAVRQLRRAAALRIKRVADQRRHAVGHHVDGGA